MPAEQQPEEAATRPAAAAASFAGSLAQTRMYGRGAQLRADAATKNGAEKKQDAPEPDKQDQAPAERTTPAEDLQTPEAAGPDTPSHDKPEASERDLEGPHEPAGEDWAAGEADAQQAEEATEVTATRPGAEPAEADGVVLACEVEDSAAARARLVQGQLELPAAGAGMPMPGVLPGVVPGL